MYDHLLGEIVEKSASRAVVRCGGVGYELRISLFSAAELRVGEVCQVYTLLNVVDGVPSLLGFTSRAERELARRLLSVTNVGPAIALAVLSVHAPSDLAAIIAAGDAAALKTVKGVGTKTAERICLELRDIVHKLDLGAPAGGRTPPSLSADDAVAALVTLGFKESDARDRVERLRRKAGAAPADDVEAIVKAALQM